MMFDSKVFIVEFYLWFDCKIKAIVILKPFTNPTREAMIWKGENGFCKEMRSIGAPKTLFC